VLCALNVRQLNPDTYVVGLREGTMLLVEDHQMCLIGKRTARIFKKGHPPVEMSDQDDLSFLLNAGKEGNK
jgi:dipeptidase E